MRENESAVLGFSVEEYRKFRKNGWMFLIMFSLLYCFLYCMRLNISSATPYLVENGWSESTIGILVGTLFWTYGIGQLISGRLSEVVGPAVFVIASVLLSAAANFLVALQDADAVMNLAILWGCNGFFQSMAWTPGIVLLSKWWPGRFRGFATGFLNAFSGFGQVAASCAVMASYLWFPQMGWKAGFIIPSCFSLTVLILYLICVRSTPEKAGLRDYQEDPDKIEEELQMRRIMKSKGILYPYKHVISNKKFLIWTVIAFVSGLSRYGLSTWIPLYFKQQGFSSVASVASAMILPVGMGIGTLVVPWLTDRFCPRDRMPAAIVSAMIGAVTILAIFMLDASSTPQLILVEIMLFVSGFCIYAINGIVFAYAADMGGRVFSGTCSGILNFAAYMGAAIQAVVYGFVLDHGGWGIVFVSIAAFNVLIAGFGMIGSRKNKCQNSWRLQAVK